MVDITEQLFLAVDTIVGERLKEINYDSTIVATIKSVQDAANYKYLCSNGSATFTAYSQDTSLKEGDSVYVTIPNNDYNQQKMIIGKYVAEDTTPFVFKRPFDNLIDVSNNLLADITQNNMILNMKLNINLNHNKPQNQIQKKLISSNVFDTSIAGFKRLGLKGLFKNFIAECEPIAGVYGYELMLISIKPTEIDSSVDPSYYSKLYIILNKAIAGDSTFTEEEEEILEEVFGSVDDIDIIKEISKLYVQSTLIFSNKDMFGNTYNFQTFTEQQKVFDISTLGPLVAYQLFFFEEGNFLDLHSRPIDPLPGERCNLFTKKPYLCVGYDLSTIEDESAILYTLNNDTYSFSDGVSNDINEKTINLRWIHKDENDNMNVYSSETDPFINSNKDDIDIRWYRYKLGQPSADEYSGVYWERIYKSTDNDSNTSNNENENNEVDGNGDTAASVAQADESKDGGNSTPSYYYYADVPSHIIYDVTGAPEFGQYTCRMYQKEHYQALAAQLTQDNPNESNNTFQDNLINNFTYNFTPDVQRAEEKIKVIIIYKDKIIKSNILTFSNERDAANEATVNLISGLNLIPNDGSAAVYNIYGYNGKILNDQNNELKTLTASFREIGGNISADSDSLEAESITWTIPTTDTMLSFPGVEAGKNCITWKSNSGSVNSRLNYQINNVYAREKTNNTIQCSIKKNGIIYNSSITFTFGTMDTSGADVNLQIVFTDQEKTALTLEYNYTEKQFCIADTNYSGEKFIKFGGAYLEKPIFIKASDTTESTIYKEAGQEDSEKEDGYLRTIISSSDPIEIEARLTDKNNQLIESSQLSLTWDFTEPQRFVTASKIENTTRCQLKLNDDFPWLDMNNYFVIIKLAIDWGDHDLTAYQPIPLRKKLLQSDLMEDDDNKVHEEISTSLSWAVGAYTGVNKTTATMNANILYPSIIYDKTSQYYKLTVSKTVNDKDEIIWVQPIIVMQNKYFSSVINEWDGKSISMDNENGVILSPAIAAGSKNDEGKFSGVMLGDWSATNTSPELTKQTGLYGFHENAVSFAFKQDGTAFIGKSGKGRINFDGNHGAIKSSSWDLEGQEIGMFLDLDDGILKMQKQKGIVPVSTLPATSDGSYKYYQNTEVSVDPDDIWQKTYQRDGIEITYDTSYTYKKRIYTKIIDINKTIEWFNANADNILYISYENYDSKTFNKYKCRCKWIEYESWTGDNFDEDKDKLYKKEGNEFILSEDEEQKYDVTYYIQTFRSQDGMSASEIASLNNNSNIREIKYAKNLIQYIKGDDINNTLEYYLREWVQESYLTNPPTGYIYTPVEFSDQKKYESNKYYYKNSNEYVLSTDETITAGVTYYERIIKWNSEYDVNPISGVEYLYKAIKKQLVDLPAGASFSGDTQYYQETDDYAKYITLSSAADTWPFAIGNMKEEEDRNFRVKWDGTCYITNGKFSGEITAESGEIGGWTISSTELSGDNVILDSETGISIVGFLTIQPSTSYGKMYLGGFEGRSDSTSTNVIGIQNSSGLNFVIENPSSATNNIIRIGNNGNGDHIILSGHATIHGLTSQSPFFQISDKITSSGEIENMFEIGKQDTTFNNKSVEGQHLICNIPASNQYGIYARFA